MRVINVKPSWEVSEFQSQIGNQKCQYLTRCYGSLTTFNIIFKNKDDQFRTSAVDRPNS